LVEKLNLFNDFESLLILLSHDKWIKVF